MPAELSPKKRLERAGIGHLREAAAAFRVVVINGPRQSGKSTSLHALREQTGGQIFDLDDGTLRAAALDDPDALVRTDDEYLYIDEFQRGGNDLVLAIKRCADDPGRNTHYILAGSTNFLTIPTLSESLAGRVVIQEIWPFSQGEIHGVRDGLLHRLIDEPDSVRDLHPEPVSREQYLDRIVNGGYPEPLRLESARLRRLWFDSYAQTVSRRDIAELNLSRRPSDVLRLLTFLAGLTAQELVQTTIGTSLGLDRSTVANYLSLLETVFLIRPLPAWSRNPLAKVTRRPKIHLTDTGLAAALQGIDRRALAAPGSPLRGQLVETFVHDEVLRQRTWSDHLVHLSHWRQPSGAEVDLVVETPGSGIVGIECKASGSVRAEDFRGLRTFKEQVGSDFRHGIVLYLGEHVVGFGEGFTALPLSALWTSA